VILSREGEDEAALAALVGRLAALGADQIWRQDAPDTKDAPEKADAPPPDPRPRIEADKRARHLLTRADHALLLGDSEAAIGHLDTLSRDVELASDVWLDLAERFHRTKTTDRVESALKQWKSVTLNDITSPIASARAVVLGGGDISELRVLQNARVSGNVCGFEKLATSMDAMGHRTEAYQFLDTAARKTDCPDVEATMLEWLAADGRLLEADELSKILVEHAPDNHRIAAVRASMLLGSGQHQAVVDLLEPLVRDAPQSDLLGTYLYAGTWLTEGEGELAALGAKSDARIDDTLTALAAAAAHHRQGADEAAVRYLARTADTYAGHPSASILQARLAFDRGDRTTASRLFGAAEGLEHDDPRVYADLYALEGELLRWTDPAAARDALRRAVLLSARKSRGPDPDLHRLKAQSAALEECIDDGTQPPCPGPFLHPRDHDANTALEAADDGTSGVFGNWLIIFGVLVLFLVIVRRGRMNRQRASRWG